MTSTRDQSAFFSPLTSVYLDEIYDMKSSSEHDKCQQGLSFVFSVIQPFSLNNYYLQTLALGVYTRTQTDIHP